MVVNATLALRCIQDDVLAAAGCVSILRLWYNEYPDKILSNRDEVQC